MESHVRMLPLNTLEQANSDLNYTYAYNKGKENAHTNREAISNTNHRFRREQQLGQSVVEFPRLNPQDLAPQV